MATITNIAPQRNRESDEEPMGKYNNTWNSLHTNEDLQQRNHLRMISSKTKKYITKTRLFKYIENFITKNWKFVR